LTGLGRTEILEDNNMLHINDMQQRNIVKRYNNVKTTRIKGQRKDKRGNIY